VLLQSLNPGGARLAAGFWQSETTLTQGHRIVGQSRGVCGKSRTQATGKGWNSVARGSRVLKQVDMISLEARVSASGVVWPVHYRNSVGAARQAKMLPGRQASVETAHVVGDDPRWGIESKHVDRGGVSDGV
jgi:hypothetical protein